MKEIRFDKQVLDHLFDCAVTEVIYEEGSVIFQLDTTKDLRVVLSVDIVNAPTVKVEKIPVLKVAKQ